MNWVNTKLRIENKNYLKEITNYDDKKMVMAYIENFENLLWS